ncbi:hypothetical protein [Paractinoplanes hotanensis]|uniref:DUF4188 domain-containing protein n=1 Tax=Paractinoplanes hotanensis TaxID=2906497 RepID=A0ABT0Y4D4_9ACTN|nr:hypothetical protein [Actinoplanes hotanensis]MCM4080890.1 hypothetical protein [Actinoplanes hotanensis]
MTIRKLTEESAEPGGAVVVTAFACRTRRDVLLLWWLHRRLKPEVGARAPHFIDVRLFVDWRRRVVRSVSLWSDVTGLYDMGRVAGHIAAARVPGRRGITTSCGVFTYRGEWQTVLFTGQDNEAVSPLVQG